jgi:hypothetical protein
MDLLCENTTGFDESLFTDVNIYLDDGCYFRSDARSEYYINRELTEEEDIKNLNIHQSEFRGFYRHGKHLYILYDRDLIFKFEVLLREYHTFAMYYTRYVVRHILSSTLPNRLAAHLICDANFICWDAGIKFPSDIISSWRRLHNIHMNCVPYSD